MLEVVQFISGKVWISGNTVYFNVDFDPFIKINFFLYLLRTHLMNLMNLEEINMPPKTDLKGMREKDGKKKGHQGLIVEIPEQAGTL